MNDIVAERLDDDAGAGEQPSQPKQVPSEKNYVVAVCISGVFGMMGIHHFYLGRYIEGILDFSMFWLAIYFYFTGQLGLAALVFIVDFIHTFVVTIMLLVGAFKDGSGKIVCYPGQKLK